MDKYPLLGGQLHWAGQNPESLLEKAESWLIIVFCFRSLFFSDDIDLVIPNMIIREATDSG